MEWIRTEHKSIQNVSNNEKAMTQVFPMIGQHLAWLVGNGSQVRVGSDAITGCRHNIFLPATLVTHLQELGLCTLNKFEKP